MKRVVGMPWTKAMAVSTCAGKRAGALFSLPYRESTACLADTKNLHSPAFTVVVKALSGREGLYAEFPLTPRQHADLRSWGTLGSLGKLLNTTKPSTIASNFESSSGNRWP